jgi:hypothetical protein
VKTTTILRAYEGVLRKRHMEFTHSRRQRDKFRAALLARIESGDRAREILHEIAEAYKASTTPEEFGSRANVVLCSYYNWEHELP